MGVHTEPDPELLDDHQDGDGVQGRRKFKADDGCEGYQSDQPTNNYRGCYVYKLYILENLRDLQEPDCSVDRNVVDCREKEFFLFSEGAEQHAAICQEVCNGGDEINYRKCFIQSKSLVDEML